MTAIIVNGFQFSYTPICINGYPLSISGHKLNVSLREESWAEFASFRCLRIGRLHMGSRIRNVWSATWWTLDTVFGCDFGSQAWQASAGPGAGADASAQKLFSGLEATK
jgi:hypothetical protein